MEGKVKPESKGNGSCMRVSPIGYAFDSIEETLIQAKMSAIPSHNSYDGILCAQAVAGCVYLARKKGSKDLIRRFAEDILGMKLDYELESLQAKNKFSALAIETCPIAIYLFLISESFEDCLRKCISIGGDVDTICAIAGAIASAFYGVSDKLVKEANKFLPKDFVKIIQSFQKQFSC
jgi:ADP-ribosylglycohydrolase